MYYYKKHKCRFSAQLMEFNSGKPEADVKSFHAVKEKHWNGKYEIVNGT